MADTLRCLTIRQPYAFAVTHGAKRVENRPWVSHYRGPLAIHAGAALHTQDGDKGENAVRRVAELAGLPVETVWHGSQLRGAVVAVANLTEVCGESRYTTWIRCACRPWGVAKQRHFILADVRVLPEPVPCRGRQRLWRLPEDVDAKVRAQLDYTTTGATP